VVDATIGRVHPRVQDTPPTRARLASKCNRGNQAS